MTGKEKQEKRKEDKEKYKNESTKNWKSGNKRKIDIFFLFSNYLTSKITNNPVCVRVAP